jgi:hypothetical protein
VIYTENKGWTLSNGDRLYVVSKLTSATRENVINANTELMCGLCS